MTSSIVEDEGGILEIASTDSDYQAFLMIAGVFLLACGSAAYMIGK